MKGKRKRKIDAAAMLPGCSINEGDRLFAAQIGFEMIYWQRGAMISRRKLDCGASPRRYAQNPEATTAHSSSGETGQQGRPSRDR